MTKGRPHVTRQDLAAALRRVGIAPGDVVFAHSSLSAFGFVEGGAETVLDALLEVLGPAGTLALPTFTWRELHEATGRALRRGQPTPCETGRIPETFRLRPGVRRSIHLCHSVAACGPATEAILADGVHSFWHGSSFDALYAADAWNLMLGVGFSPVPRSTPPRRRSASPTAPTAPYPGCRIRLPGGETIPCPPALEYLRHDDSFNDFAKMEGILRDRGLVLETAVGAGTIMNCRIRDVIDTACELLAADVRFLSGKR